MSEARERWDARYREGAGARDPDPFLSQARAWLPAPGRALDLAGGTGRHAIALAKEGWDLTLADLSPAGLAEATRRAAAAGVSLRTLEWDAEARGVPPGPWDLILVFHYLHRPLFPDFPAALAPGGVLLFCQPTRRNLERNPRPSARWLLAEGELEDLVPPELEVLSLEEGWLRGRHEARLVARRPRA